MKKQGNSGDYMPQRNEELLKAFKQELVHLGALSHDEIFARAARREASRFWVGEQRASVVVSRMFKGDKLQNMNPTRRRMYYEIFRRVKMIMEKNPKQTLSSAVFEAVNSPAPEFYLTDKSARVIIYRLRA